MKKIKMSAIFATVLCTLVACGEKNGPTTEPATLSFTPSGKIVLTEDAKDQTALTVSWNSVGTGVNYTLFMLPANSNDKANALKKETAETSVSYTGEELQTALLGFGYNPGTNVSVKFVLSSGADESSANVNVVLYTHVVTLAIPEITLSSAAVELDDAEKDNEALKVSWTDASVEDAYVEYTLRIAKADDASFSNALVYDAKDALEYSFTVNDLFFALRGIDYKPGETASLIVRVDADPADGTIESVKSETAALTVKLYEKAKNADIPSGVTLLGDGTDYGWDMNAADAQLELTDAANGIFECDANINSVRGTFKFYFDKNWNKGFKPGTGDYYWEDVTIPERLGDNDYFRMLIPGKYHFVLNTTEVSISYTLLESFINEVYVHGPAAAEEGSESGDAAIVATGKDTGIFSGTVKLTAGKNFRISSDPSDAGRGYFCHSSSTPLGTSWKVSEDREKTGEYAEFSVADTGEYVITLNTVTHTLTAVPAE